jgi:type VI secretion system protein ImpH
MATDGRRTDPSVEEMLFESGFQFDFFQAVRLLAQVYPKRKLVGGTARPADEIVRFSAWPPEPERMSTVMGFPASAIDFILRPPEAARGRNQFPARMSVLFFGLTGTQGVLPLHYTELLIERKSAKHSDSVLADFLDLFNHRLVSLFYRAWAKHRLPVVFESGARAGGGQPDNFTHYVFDFMGLGTAGIRKKMQIPDESLLPYAGLIAQRPHSASALRGILADYFGVPIEIQQCLGNWYELAEGDRSYLAPEMERNQLGVGAFLGDKVWNQQDRFRICVGPLKLSRFHEFLPNGEELGKLMEVTQFVVGQALSFDVQVILDKDDIPECRLTSEGEGAARLGWMSWLKTKEFKADAREAVFGQALAAGLL